MRRAVILTAVMASWTQEERDAVRAAVVKLATGERVVSISFAGPPAQTIAYAAAELDKLRAFLAEMERSVSGSPAYRRVAFSRGFDGE